MLSRRETFLLFLVIVALMVPNQVGQNLAKSFNFPFPPPPFDYDTAKTGRRTTTEKKKNDDNNKKGFFLLDKLAALQQQQQKEEQSHNGQQRVQPQPTSRGLFDGNATVVHVIQTRFMQHQHELSHLARARMELFQTFTLTSLVRQSHKHFLWLIWLEPHLDEDVRRDFLQLLQTKVVLPGKLPHVLVLGTTEDVRLPDLRHDFFDEANFLTSRVYLGDYETLLEFREAAATRVVLDTTLDADDAVYFDFVQSVQQEALKTLGTTSLPNDFRYWCAPQTLYWKYYNPWYASSKRGHFVATNHLKQKEKICPTGGFTRGLAAGTLPADVPAIPRHELHTKTPPCGHVLQHKCLQRLHAGSSEFAILRARTPAAVGVSESMPYYHTKDLSKEKDKSAFNKKPNVKLQAHEQAWKHKQDETWKTLVPKAFGLTEASVSRMRLKLESNMLAIILDGMQGICTAGHSCKPADKYALRKLKLIYKYPERYGLTLPKPGEGIEEDDEEEDEDFMLQGNAERAAAEQEDESEGKLEGDSETPRDEAQDSASTGDGEEDLALASLDKFASGSAARKTHAGGEENGSPLASLDKFGGEKAESKSGEDSSPLSSLDKLTGGSSSTSKTRSALDSLDALANTGGSSVSNAKQPSAETSSSALASLDELTSDTANKARSVTSVPSQDDSSSALASLNELAAASDSKSANPADSGLESLDALVGSDNSETKDASSSSSSVPNDNDDDSKPAIQDAPKDQANKDEEQLSPPPQKKPALPEISPEQLLLGDSEVESFAEDD